MKISTRIAACLLFAGIMMATPAAAQDVHVHTPAAAPALNGWQWHIDAHAFFGVNQQERKFRNFTAWESQNWLMGMGERTVGKGTLTLMSMLSLEPLTLKDIGSPQVFQTGETFGTPPSALVDYQHPHDLFMGLGSEYRRLVGRVTLIAGADLVGSPTIGPQAFMHRPSAEDNPQAPLSHHHMDSTHITPGVLRGGLQAGPWRAEASVFHGREPDQDRYDIDLGRLDSAAARLSWNRGSWSAQVSAAALTMPELITPYDAKRLTASVAFTSGGDRRVAWLAGFGQNREIHGNLEAYLFEATLRPSPMNSFYTRVESVAKDILDNGFHPRGVFHRHRQSQVGAFTLGYIRDLLHMSAGTFGAGADITGYTVPANLEDSYRLATVVPHLSEIPRTDRLVVLRCAGARALMVRLTPMARTRRSLSLAVWFWLVCQAATIAAAPFAQSKNFSAVEDEVCCPGIAPGQMCPMHHHPHRTPPRPGDALLRCECPPPDAALASLILGTGFLPPTVLLADAVFAEPVAVSSATEISRADIPSTPPPKR